MTAHAKTKKIRIRQIEIGINRRSVDPVNVRALAESMAKIGLRTPVTVRERKGKFILVTGLHRLRAAKLLKWSKIDAFILTGRKTDARLWEYSENLHRAELTVLERADLIDEWRKLIRKRAAQVGRPGGEQPKEAGIAKTAKRLGFSRAEVSRAHKIAAISPKVKAAVEKAGLANNQTRLLAIANGKTPEAQQEILQQTIEGKGAPGRKQSQQQKINPEPNLTTVKADLVAQIKKNRKLRAKIIAQRKTIQKLKQVRANLRDKLTKAEEELAANSW